MELVTLSDTQKMSSLEIAELCGKRHNDVTRDIRKILKEAGIEGAQFCAPWKLPSGQTSTIYQDVNVIW